MPEILGIPTEIPRSRSEEAYQGLKRMIFRSEVLPGQWLRKRDMAARLQMSPTPVIEAFRRLEHEGLVTVMPQFGARVRTWTVDEIAEGLEMRASLEGLIAARCAVVAEDWEIAQLRPMAEKVDEEGLRFCDVQTPPTLEPGMTSNDDLRFHGKLAELSGFKLIAREIERLQLLQLTCRLFAFPAEPSDVTHMQIIDAISSRDEQLAETQMRRHIRHSVYVLPRLRKRFGDGPVDFQSGNRER